ncbi:acyl-CoA thioesterase [Blastococcus saxobsidens]|uniref:Acyl-CoA thioesterase 2 n=1 Tax=Blastococcus saxobsidens (strain DD2) TaxID=1146883 RepID=H6RLK5_BLASD|nr:acyl-CoA thioesterase domain-containing protein [Blastococcus saxobsidens]CCG03731.1 Acyl-CoA thioesterase [Blastococcus saxobsidens DD2]
MDLHRGDDPPAPPRRPGVAPAGLTGLLRLTPVEEGVFRAGPRSTVTGHAFGGAVAAQALLAAGHTVPAERAVHSIHGHFLRPGDITAPTDFRVTPVRDGGSYTLRSVVAEQHGAAVFALTASFQAPEEGWRHQLPELDAPAPEDLPPLEEAADATDGPVRQWLSRLAERHGFEFRFAGELPRVAAARDERAHPRQRFWLRSREPLADEPLAHSCAVTYASDMLLLSTALAPHATVVGAPGVAAASLDHAVWFHEPARVDQWLFYDQESSWAGGGRTLCRGRIFDRSGRLVATVVQEGMVRRRPR